MSRLTRTVAAVAVLAAVVVLCQQHVQAERTRFWRQSTYEEFEKGTPKGVALRSDGRLVLAPRFAQFADPNAAYLWVLRIDSKGVLYAGGGTNAKVVRFDEKGAAAPIFDSPELTVQALAFDARDNLYVGTSPDGKVYRVAPGGQKSVFFEPKTKYIWDLVVDAAGTVFVATGDKGEVYAVSPDGKGEVYFRSSETHIRSLTLDTRGNLILGTEPNGRVIRVDKLAPKIPAAAAEKDKTEVREGFVLFETDRKEVTSLLPDSKGNLFVASIGEKPRGVGTLSTQQTLVPQATVTSTGQTITTSVPMPVQQPTPFTPFPQLTGGSVVYRIATDGAPEELWSSREDLAYSLALSPAEKLLIGTGNRGLVIQLDGNRIYSTYPKTAAAQVTGMARASSGKVFVATANPGKVFALGPEFEPEGSFESQTFDAKIFSQWGRLSWWGEDGATNGNLAFYVRSGNTSGPERNWSSWAGPYANAAGETAGCPPARFAQWKVVFKNPAAGPSGAPATNISWVSLAYLPKNLPPTVDAIVVQNPNVRVQGFVAQGQPQQSAQLRMPPVFGFPGLGVFGGSPQQQSPARFDPPPQGFIQRGYQSVLWSARDENDDELVYTVYYRGEGEKNWKLLKEKVEQKYLTWESSTMPDGAYVLKIVASDSPSNPQDQALSGERESDRFEVDNTPPRIEGLRAEEGNPEVKVLFEAHDSYSAISRAEYSLDGGEWRLTFPAGRVTDAPQESYVIALRDLPAGEHTLAVRVFDQFENSASAKSTFMFPAIKKK